MQTFGLNRMDLLQREGKYPLPPGASKTVMGVEFAGTVTSVGEGVSEYKTGDEVFGLSFGVSRVELELGAAKAGVEAVPAERRLVGLGLGVLSLSCRCLRAAACVPRLYTSPGSADMMPLSTGRVR